MRTTIGRSRLVPFLAIHLFAALAISAPLLAESATDRLFVVVKVADNVLADIPARASAITPDGVLLDYAEELLDSSPNTQGFLLSELPPGLLDVRVEGEGMVTEVKKGVPVFADRDEKVLIVVRPGQGVHIVEYAVAGLSREEVAARLAHLDSDTAALRAELAALRARP